MKIKKGDYSVIPDEEKDKSNNKGSGPRCYRDWETDRKSVV